MEESTVTEAQVEIWLDSPVTKALLRTMELRLSDIGGRSVSSYVDSTNADLTFANVHLSMGEEQTLERYLDPVTELIRFDLLEIQEQEDGSD